MIVLTWPSMIEGTPTKDENSNAKVMQDITSTWLSTTEGPPTKGDTQLYIQGDNYLSHISLPPKGQFPESNIRSRIKATHVRLLPLGQDQQLHTDAHQNTDTLLLQISPNLPRFGVQMEDLPGLPITEALPISKHSLRDHPERSSTTESMVGLQHWMSVRQQHVYLSLIFFAVGFSAITALAIATIGLLPLDIAAYIFVWPSIITWLVLSILYPKYGKIALKGFIIGMLACLFYDCMRFAAIALGLWGDFIPRIGMWLFHTNKPDWVVGYIWRYVGDGGFMSVTFVMGYYLLKPKLDVRIAALFFGVAIWACLIGTILLAPHGTEMLFRLTPITFSLSLLGHIIYGLSIGYLYPIFILKQVPSKLRTVSHQTNINRQSVVTSLRHFWRTLEAS